VFLDELAKDWRLLKFPQATRSNRQLETTQPAHPQDTREKSKAAKKIS